MWADRVVTELIARSATGELRLTAGGHPPSGRDRADTEVDGGRHTGGPVG
jgi:hypothetical protein